MPVNTDAARALQVGLGSSAIAARIVANLEGDSAMAALDQRALAIAAGRSDLASELATKIDTPAALGASARNVVRQVVPHNYYYSDLITRAENAS